MASLFKGVVFEGYICVERGIAQLKWIGKACQEGIGDGVSACHLIVGFENAQTAVVLDKGHEGEAVDSEGARDFGVDHADVAMGEVEIGIDKQKGGTPSVGFEELEGGCGVVGGKLVFAIEGASCVEV